MWVVQVRLDAGTARVEIPEAERQLCGNLHWAVAKLFWPETVLARAGLP